MAERMNLIGLRSQEREGVCRSMGSGRFVILGGMPIGPEAALIRADDLICAADAGFQQALALGLYPSLCIGDWDSGQRPVTEAEVITLPCMKDDTDTQYAAETALKRGYREILLFGCTGGRLDHTFASIQTMLFLVNQGADCSILAENDRVTAVRNGTALFQNEKDWYFSVFAAQGNAGGVTLSGVRYPLEDAEITETYPIGVSNEITEANCRVSVRQGTLIVIRSRKR